MRAMTTWRVAGRTVAVLAVLGTGWLVAAVTLTGLGRRLTAPVAGGTTAGRPVVDAVAGGAAVAAALLVLTWFAVSLAGALVATARCRLDGSRPPEPSGPGRSGAPRLVRRLAALLLGAGVAAAPATVLWAPAASASGPAADRPLAATSVDRPAAPPPATAGPPAVRVRPGDSLWVIAARHLGADPPDAAVARAWPRWHQANRGLIGADPDLLVPGQLLHPPTTEEPR